MKILDKSNYFKGLLLLAGKDNIIDNKEEELLKQVGQTLGFEQKFYEDAIRYILENEFISKEPPKFSEKIIAECFILDGIKLALVDKNLSPDEIEWLKDVATINDIDKGWLNSELRSFVVKGEHKKKSDLLHVNRLQKSA